MGKTFKELVTNITLAELMEWVAYYNIEPWGEKVDGMRAALNTSAIYNAGLMNADPKRLKSKPFTPEQFYVGINPTEVNSKSTPSWKEQKKTFNKFFKASS